MSLPFTLTGWKRFGSVAGDCWKSYFPPNPALWEPACFDYANDVPRIQIVVVESNNFEDHLHMPSPLGLLNGFPPRAVVSGFFIVPTISVLHTIVRPQPGGVEEKGTRYAVRLGGSSRIIRATGRIVKSGAHRKSGGMTIPSGGETLFLPTSLLWGRGVFG